MVRQVRNHLESRGAAPLLFHLMSLADPDQFWPIIESEIDARSFFLYCESPAAEQSTWVQRERQAVARAASSVPKRIGTVRVDSPVLDQHALDAFLLNTRVFLSYAMPDRDAVAPFRRALLDAGFQVSDPESIPLSTNLMDGIDREIRRAATQGWVVVFESANAASSQWVWRELSMAESFSARVAVVRLGDEAGSTAEGADDALHNSRLARHRAIDARSDPLGAVESLVRLLLGG